VRSFRSYGPGWGKDDRHHDADGGRGSAPKCCLVSGVIRSGLKDTKIAAQLAVDVGTVRKWRERLAVERLDDRADAARSGRPRT
jgi:hypothetical protein